MICKLLFSCEEDERIFRTFEPPLPTVTDHWTDINGNPSRDGGRLIDIEKDADVTEEDSLNFIITINSNDHRSITHATIEFQHLANPFDNIGFQIGYLPWDTIRMTIPDVEVILSYSTSYFEMSKFYYNSRIPAFLNVPIMGTNGCQFPLFPQFDAFRCKIVCERTNIRMSIHFDDNSSVVLAPMTFFTVFNSDECAFE